MQTRVRVGVACAALVALAGSLLDPGSGTAAGGKNPVTAVKLVAAALEKGDDKTAKAQAAAIAKTFELDEVMNLMKLRSKKGLGVGPKPGAISPDGIEAKLMPLARKVLTKKQLDNESDAIAEMAYVIAAIGEIAAHSPMPKGKKGGRMEDWVDWSKDMRKLGVELAKAAKARNAKDIKGLSSKLNSNCNTCHGIFR
jgi:hypothetical protein